MEYLYREVGEDTLLRNIGSNKTYTAPKPEDGILYMLVCRDRDCNLNFRSRPKLRFLVANDIIIISFKIPMQFFTLWQEGMILLGLKSGVKRKCKDVRKMK
jgi:hypothetical protein